MLPSPRLIICLYALSLASLLDLRACKVPNILWVYFSSVGFSTVVLESLFESGLSLLSSALLHSLLILTLSWLLFYTRLIGGADAKALLMISLLMPEPEYLFYNSGWPTQPISALSALDNAAVLSLLFHFIKRMFNHSSSVGLTQRRPFIPSLLLGMLTAMLGVDFVHIAYLRLSS